MQFSKLASSRACLFEVTDIYYWQCLALLCFLVFYLDAFLYVGSGRGRFPSARGNGYRNEGGRGGRGYGGSRGYGRGDFAGRGDFGSRNGNRGGLANRGGDGYQRAENGGRVSRADGFSAPVHATAKSTAIRVSASA